MAFIRGEMTSEDGKTIYCTAEHHKVNIPALKEHTAIRTKWDEEFEDILKQVKGKL
jgi:acyl-coenzyme A thioesterase 13